jgi:hypothetical protein
MSDEAREAFVSWTAADQRRADNFERQTVPLQRQLRGGHPDLIIVGLVQTVRSLMAQRLMTEPAAHDRYTAIIGWLAAQEADAALAARATASA